jgi:prepilin-type processing-associated H-X9-DG protein
MSPEIPKLDYQSPTPRSRQWPVFIVPIMALLLLGGFLMLPSIGRSRPEAMRIKCASNMKQIGMAILLYSNENHNQYPPTLDALIPTEDIGSEAFVCPQTPDTPATGPTTQAIASQLSTGNHLSYIYLGAGLTNPCDPNTVVLLEPLSNHSNSGSNILFGDGHVEFVTLPAARQILDRYANGEHPLIYNPNPPPTTTRSSH